ncbi:MAG: hypothetical protein A2X49_09310 [Lentisphaerae bacterium GWF2_52_8]|nr:MAG: hypothetical protein A2X49_09310 [Lentisphaerae bacterium GWF2_52_8]
MSDVWDTLNIRIQTSALTDCKESWANAGRTLHNDPFNRIYWIRKGEAFIEHDGETHHLTRGDLHVIPAHSPGYYRCPDRMDLYWCHFNATVLAEIELFDYAKCQLNCHIPKSDYARMDQFWERLVSLSKENNPAAKFESSGILCLLLAKMLGSIDRNELERRNSAYEKFAPVFEYVEKHMHKKVKVKELAALVHLQENYFSNLFHKSFGLSPISYLKRQRVKRAQALLKAGDSSLKRIAEDCGFGSPFHFSLAFKELVGVPPGVFRRMDSAGGP